MIDLVAKQKALDTLVQKVVNNTAMEYEIKIYSHLKKMGVVK